MNKWLPKEGKRSTQELEDAVYIVILPVLAFSPFLQHQLLSTWTCWPTPHPPPFPLPLALRPRLVAI